MAKFLVEFFTVYFLCKCKTQENEALNKIKKIYYFSKEKEKRKLTSGLCRKTFIFMFKGQGRSSFRDQGKQ